MFYDDAFSLSQLEVGRCRTDVDHLVDSLLELLEAEWAVVEGGWQTVAILHEIGLPAAVAAIHGAYLWNGDVTLVDNHQIVFREEVEQAVRSFACFSSIEVAAVILNAGTMAEFLNHLHIEFHTFLDAMGLLRLSHLLEKGHLLHQVVLDVVDGDIGLLL